MKHYTLIIKILHVGIFAAALLAELHDVSDIFLRKHYRCLNDRLFHVIDGCRIRHVRRVRTVNNRTVSKMDLIDNRRSCTDEVEIEFALESFLDYFIVKKS